MILNGGQGRNRTALCKCSQHSTYRHYSESSGVRIGGYTLMHPGNVPNPKATAVQDAVRHARGSAVEILGRWGGLSNAERMQIVRAFRSALIPRRRAGRKPSATLTAAYAEWKSGTRGPALFRKHISNWERLSRWRRKAEQRSLMDAIYSRNRRDRAKQAACAKDPAV